MIVDCYRGAGDRPGDPVEAPLLSDEMLLVRGAAEMDAQSHRVNAVTLDLVPRPGTRLGQTVEYNDPVTGRAARGKVVGIRIAVVGGAPDAAPVIDHVLTAEVPAS